MAFQDNSFYLSIQQSYWVIYFGTLLFFFFTIFDLSEAIFPPNLQVDVGKQEKCKK